jgi:hypothetical protein
MCAQPTPSTKRDERFSVDRRGRLVRAVTPERGEPYEHRCPRWAFEAVCHRFDEHASGDTVESIAAAENMPITQAATALAFLLERGIVTREGRRNYAASGGVHLDGMTEYWALVEEPSAE